MHVLDCADSLPSDSLDAPHLARESIKPLVLDMDAASPATRDANAEELNALRGTKRLGVGFNDDGSAEGVTASNSIGPGLGDLEP